jgi:S1-C subfamily serine protease
MTRWLSVLLLAVAGVLMYLVFQDRTQKPARLPAAEPRAVTARGDLAEDERATIELFREVAPSVVQVTSLAQARSPFSVNVTEIPQGTGSGFLWDNIGHVVTNYHVIERSKLAAVTLSDGTVLKADVVGTAPSKDLAVLLIQQGPPDKLKPIPVGTSNNLMVGQKVFAIGNPFGFDQTLTTGIISGVGREITSVTQNPIQDVIQTDAAINRGNSGGPLLDSAGRVIGINTAIYSPTGTSAGIGFAVPVDTINRIVPQLISHGRPLQPGLGIHMVRDEVARRFNIPGVLILEVREGSPAERAGLVGTRILEDGRVIPGDAIIEINGKAVDSWNDLFKVLDRQNVGDQVEVKTWRDGEERTTRVTLEALP